MGHLLAVGDTVEEAIGRVTYAAAQLGSWPAAAGRGVARARPAAGDDRARSGIEASGAPTPPSAGGRWPQSVMRRAGTLACTLLAASACAPGGYEARWVGRGYHVHPAPALDLAPPRVRPLVVGITGPAEVATPGRQWFRAHASGGLGEYRYAWEVAGDTDHFRPTGVTGPVLVRQVGSGDVVRLRVTVTSGAQHATAVRRVEGPPPVTAD
jgi:hypothetical protein